MSSVLTFSFDVSDDSDSSISSRQVCDPLPSSRVHFSIANNDHSSSPSQIVAPQVVAPQLIANTQGSLSLRITSPDPSDSDSDFPSPHVQFVNPHDFINPHDVQSPFSNTNRNESDATQRGESKTKPPTRSLHSPHSGQSLSVLHIVTTDDPPSSSPSFLSLNDLQASSTPRLLSVSETASELQSLFHSPPTLYSSSITRGTHFNSSRNSSMGEALPYITTTIQISALFVMPSNVNKLLNEYLWISYSHTYPYDLSTRNPSENDTLNQSEDGFIDEKVVFKKKQVHFQKERLSLQLSLQSHSQLQQTDQNKKQTRTILPKSVGSHNKHLHATRCAQIQELHRNECRKYETNWNNLLSGKHKNIIQ
jgi:hypothetical protein